MSDFFSKSDLRLTRRLSLKRGLIAGAAAAITCLAVEPAKAGYGRCSKCTCPGFELDYTNKEICNNCGHNYTAHW